MPADDSACRPIPKSVPRTSLAYKWCQLGGDRSVMHHSFKRWTPLDYDRDELDKRIDSDLEKYPEALEVFPEKIPVRTIEDEEERARMERIENMLRGFAEEWTGGNVKLAADRVLKWSFDVSEDDVRRAAKAVYGYDYA
ncbi:MAG: hypothetical protein OXI27_06095 [Thaumarchaeota archaeon]|nr:hypothetical protein [Nitrososphaerota archaeon]